MIIIIIIDIMLSIHLKVKKNVKIYQNYSTVYPQNKALYNWNVIKKNIT